MGYRTCINNTKAEQREVGAVTEYKVTDPSEVNFEYAAGLIVLNESQFIGQWLTCHYGMFDQIVIVEGSDPYYPRDSVSANGLSLDATADIIRAFPDPDDKITFIQHGWAAPPVESPDPNAEGYREGEGKCILRDRVAQVLNERRFEGIYIQCDADEFYPPEVQEALKYEVARVTAKNKNRRLEVTYYVADQGYIAAEDLTPLEIEGIMGQADEAGLIEGNMARVETEFPPGRIHAFRFPTVHLWHDSTTMIAGGYFDVEHTRVFRWKVGSRYEWKNRKSHNWPISPEGRPMMKHGSHQITRTFDMIPKPGFEVAETIDQLAGVAHSRPYCLHVGFTRPGDELRDRNSYYRARGEEVSRPDTLADRELWFADDPKKLFERDVHVFAWLGHNPLDQGDDV